MPLWEPNEISKLWNASYRNSRNKDHVRELFSQWGGCVRWILEKPYEDSKDKLQEAVDSSTGENLLAACRSENDDKVNLFCACYVHLLPVLKVIDLNYLRMSDLDQQVGT